MILILMGRKVSLTVELKSEGGSWLIGGKDPRRAVLLAAIIGFKRGKSE